MLDSEQKADDEYTKKYIMRVKILILNNKQDFVL